MTRRRIAAAAALLLGAVTVALAVYVAVHYFKNGLLVLVCGLLAAGGLWFGIRRRGVARLIGLGAAAALLVGTGVLAAVNGTPLVNLLILVTLVLALAAARIAFRVHVPLPPAARPRKPVLIYNPLSGDGKAEQFNLAAEARDRGYEAVELNRSNDLETLVRDAVAGGADAVAMAGGDGSQAIVASIAAELDLPYACIPSGTRNHFALDLGVDRDDVVGALDAFVDGGERRVDLAEVNGRVFVNNVSLGLYAEAVQRDGYREAKIRTIIDTVPDVLGADEEEGLDLRWTGPDGRERASGGALLVSNNRYRLGKALASGTRPAIDDGCLGITVFEAPSEREASSGPLPWSEWSTEEFEVRSAEPVPAGVDGEALVLDAPLQFRIRPGVLRVRIAHKHPGASPSAAIPSGSLAVLRELWRIATGSGEPRSA